MQVHPGKKIQMELKDRSWTQRQFAFLLWKKVSEVNELIKWKRNITVQRDILLSHVLWTKRKYRLELQNEYDYYLIESDFNLSKLPNLKDQHWLTLTNIDKNSHKVSEQENKVNIIPLKRDSLHSDSGRKITTPEWQEQEKKDKELASNHTHDSNKEHKIDKDVDIKQPEKHPKQDSKKDQKIDKIHEKNISSKQGLSSLDSGRKIITPEWQEKLEEKKDKYDRQKIYKPDDKFDSYFPPKEKKLEHKKHQISNKSSVSSFPSSPALPTGQAGPLQREHNLDRPKEWEKKKDTKKDHHKHKENIFRNF